MRTHELLLIVTLATAGEAVSEDLGNRGPLRLVTFEQLQTILPQGIRLMMRPADIEQFLAELDEEPPDWRVVYGHGHHDPGHDDRLFALNRDRDAKREGRAALRDQVAFAWAATLSDYDPVMGGFPVAIGPKFIKTRWGMIRFKPEDAPANLTVDVEGASRDHLQRRLADGQSVEIDVVMTGQLVPEESIVYDFSHDEEGLGLIMPVVRVEHVEFVMPVLEGPR